MAWLQGGARLTGLMSVLGGKRTFQSMEDRFGLNHSPPLRGFAGPSSFTQTQQRRAEIGLKLALRLVGLAGLIGFGLSLALTYLSPIHVEHVARGFIQNQIERQIRDELGIGREGAGESRIGGLAEDLAEQHNEEIGALRERLATGLNAQVTATVARMQDLGCECRERMRQWLDVATQLRISTLQRAEPQLRQVIEGKYSEIVADLLRDLRIFLGTNLLAFVLLLVLSIAKPSHVRQLFVPGILLGVAAVAGSVIYLFGQNWFFTLLYGDFVGWAYGVWLLLIFGLFCDIVLFKARVTTRIVDALSTAVPC